MRMGARVLNEAVQLRKAEFDGFGHRENAWGSTPEMLNILPHKTKGEDSSSMFTSPYNP